MEGNDITLAKDVMKDVLSVLYRLPANAKRINIMQFGSRGVIKQWPLPTTFDANALEHAIDYITNSIYCKSDFGNTDILGGLERKLVVNQ